MINWNELNKNDAKIISRICKKAVKEFSTIDVMNLNMDISAVHIKTPLNLEKFESFDDVNFFHDVFGISRHIDRTTGKLKDHFLPRCSM